MFCNCECCQKINWKKVILGGLAYLVIATIVRQVEVVLTMKYYLMPEYFGVWSKLMMPTAGPPPTSFMVWSFLFTFATGFVLAAVYGCTQGMFSKKYWEKILCFTGAMAILMLVFSSLPMYLLINLPLGLQVYWFVTGIITVLLGTMVFAKIIK